MVAAAARPKEPRAVATDGEKLDDALAALRDSVIARLEKKSEQ